MRLPKIFTLYFLGSLVLTPAYPSMGLTMLVIGFVVMVFLAVEEFKSQRRRNNEIPGAMTVEYELAGITQKNKDGTPRQDLIQYCFKGMPIDLVREPDNKHDPSAVAVFCKFGQIGYIDSLSSDNVSKVLEADRVRNARIRKVIPSDNEKYLDVRIQFDRLPYIKPKKQAA